MRIFYMIFLLFFNFSLFKNKKYKSDTSDESGKEYRHDVDTCIVCNQQQCRPIMKMEKKLLLSMMYRSHRQQEII